jgi:hypothetical protein
VHEKHNFNLSVKKKKKAGIKPTEQRTPKAKKKNKFEQNKKPNEEINKSMKPGKANQKPKGKEHTFETQTTIEP